MRNISKIENLNTYIECEKKQNIYLEFFQYHAEEKNYMTDQSDHFNQNYFSLRKKRKQKKMQMVLLLLQIILLVFLQGKIFFLLNVEKL